MTKPSNGHGVRIPGQSKPFTLPYTFTQIVRQPVVIAALVVGAGIGLLGNTRASSPAQNPREARASLEAITAQMPALAFTVPQELKAEAQTAATGPKDLVPVTRFIATAAAAPSGPDLQPQSLPQELSLSPAPDVAREAQPLPPKIKGAYPRGLHPVIKHSMVEASRYLPEGWQLEFMNALRDAPGVWNGPHGKRDKTGGALAVDVWLVSPKGERLCNFKCTQHFEAYQTFMQMVKHIQDRDFPAYRNQGRWGGYFGGSYANDEMHYDLEPSAWTAAGNWEKGLFPGYAYFGRPGDVGKGMGQIASYRLPATGTALASLAAPVQNSAPIAVAAKSTPKAPERVAALAAIPAPVAVPVLAQPVKAAAVQRVIPVQQAALQWKTRPQRVYRQQLRQRFESDEDAEARAEYRESMRTAQASRYTRRNARTMRDYGDE
jgi:hypothetical protein